MVLVLDVNILVVETPHKTAPKTSWTGFAFGNTSLVVHAASKWMI
jgi:hypothetical protein